MISKAKEDDMILQKYTEFKNKAYECDDVTYNWDGLSYVDKAALAKVIADNVIRYTCAEFDRNMEFRKGWHEMSNMVGKELVLLITEMWL